MSQPRFITADESGHLRDEHLPEHAQEAVTLASVTDPATPLGRQVQQAQVAPYLVPLAPRFEPRRHVLVQGASPRVAYAVRADGGPGRPFDKTDDGGLTWTQQGSMPFAVTGMIRLASGTFLCVEDIQHAALGNARLARSTNDGQSWQVIEAGFRLPPISQQGMCEGTDGSVAIAEYGNIANTVYRILRSTDDGLTWTTVLSSDGVEPSTDPGHYHSLTYDPVEKCHIVFQDRPDNLGFDGPRIWISRDNMATWSILGSSVDWDHPNFVSPMYFRNYIAWGSDNQVNGRISRMRRDHFYSGNWAGNTEHVYQTDQKCLYYTHPLREDVWLVSTAVEHIKSSAQDGRVGSYAPNILVVDQDGARVSGGLDAVSDRGAGDTSPGRFSFPSLPLGHVESDGWGWIDIRGTGSVPVTQGWSPPTHIVEYDKNTVVREYQDLLAKNITGETFPVARTRADYFEITNGKTAGHAAIRVSKTPDASIAFRSKGTDVAYLRPAYDHLVFRNGLGFGDSAQMQGELLVRYGQASPEGVVTARGGSLYLCWGSSAAPGDTGLWVKENPNVGSTGWVKK